MDRCHVILTTIIVVIAVEQSDSNSDDDVLVEKLRDMTALGVDTRDVTLEMELRLMSAVWQPLNDLMQVFLYDVMTEQVLSGDNEVTDPHVHCMDLISNGAQLAGCSSIFSRH